MSYLDKMWEEIVDEQSRFEVLAAKLISQKLKQQGIELTDEQEAMLPSRIKQNGDDSIDIDIDDILQQHGIDESESIKLDFDDAEAEGLVDELAENLNQQLAAFTKAASKKWLASLKKTLPGMLRERRSIQARFEARLYRRWQRGLDLLEMLIVISLEAGSEFNEEFRSQAVIEHNLVFEVLTRLHARACQVAQEVLTLLRAGFADGAHARWRTLHEIVVVAWFIKEHGNDTANRYLLHHHIEALRGARQQREFASRLNIRGPSLTEITNLESDAAQLESQFGGDYTNEYGWAGAALGTRRPTFRNIEQAVNFDHWRPYYKMASHNVHANPTGIEFRLGSPNERLLLAGPSNSGLTAPGHGTAISLGQITVALLNIQESVHRTTASNIIIKLLDEIGSAFLRSQQSLQRRGFRRKRFSAQLRHGKKG